MALQICTSQISTYIDWGWADTPSEDPHPNPNYVLSLLFCYYFIEIQMNKINFSPRRGPRIVTFCTGFKITQQNCLASRGLSPGGIDKVGAW